VSSGVGELAGDLKSQEGMLPLSILDALDLEPHPGSLLDPQGRVLYVNAAWMRASASGHAAPGSGLRGALWIDHVPAEERAPLREVLQQVLLQPRGTSAGITRVGRCNCDGRMTSTRFVPVFNPDGEDVLGIVVLHTAVTEAPALPVPPDHPPAYAHADGLVHQCTSCRRVQLPGEPRWEYLASYAEKPPRATTHGICPTCFEATYARHEDRPPGSDRAA
jgi:hypothetical protein